MPDAANASRVLTDRGRSESSDVRPEVLCYQFMPGVSWSGSNRPHLSLGPRLVTRRDLEIRIDPCRMPDQQSRPAAGFSRSYL